MTKKTCDQCKYCLLEDFGYSNYTVDGTEASCILDLNPGLPKDYWYGQEPALNYAEHCSNFTHGEPILVDVDHNEGNLENYTDDPELKALILRRGADLLNEENQVERISTD